MQSAHIICLELQAVSLALKHFLPFEGASCSGQNKQTHDSGMHQQTWGGSSHVICTHWHTAYCR